MKINKILGNTTNSRVYKLAVNETVSGCPICSPNKGCNRNKNFDNCWKTYRKTQWRD